VGPSPSTDPEHEPPHAVAELLVDLKLYSYALYLTLKPMQSLLIVTAFN
jgi:hypothetical protein